VKRGTIVVVAARRRKHWHTGGPHLVVQSDLFNPTHASVTVCPITSDCVDAPLFRLPLPPGTRTGLHEVSQVMIDKILSIPRAAIGNEIGECDGHELEDVYDGLRRWLELG
jgi:mRNA interferase MazF